MKVLILTCHTGDGHNSAAYAMAQEMEPLHKCRGEAKSLDTLVCLLKSAELSRGKIRIAHCRNQGAAQRLKEQLCEAFSHVSVSVAPCRGLCSYYAESGGLLVGFEKE